ncbi:hypothetical protein Mboo_2296 [Methanoregula boonei 6A8]|uniref:Uncharacterized protein n=1 Tax=Methanoregula boonei (strain DSM 21154 / JCM 14090 / 6A8) TaxID=456442 RepID=A7IAP9_METB6|nr:hypothetical protein Mboo_2296 [Methanoregula boonei 6A8]
MIEGERKRKMIRAYQITPEFVQVNARVTAYGEKTLDELFPNVEGAEKRKKTKERKVQEYVSRAKILFSRFVVFVS